MRFFIKKGKSRAKRILGRFEEKSRKQVGKSVRNIVFPAFFENVSAEAVPEKSPSYRKDRRFLRDKVLHVLPVSVFPYAGEKKYHLTGMKTGSGWYDPGKIVSVQ